MTDSYLPIVVMVILATAFAALSFIASTLLAPRKPTSAKLAPYECGIVPEHEALERFPVKFYLVAMIFIVFDVEIIFLYPWAVVYRRLGLYGLVEMGLFALAVLVAYAYLLSSGALNWGPARRFASRIGEPVLRAGRPGTPAGPTTEPDLEREQVA